MDASGTHSMTFTRIYSDIDGESHFEDVAVPLHDEGMVGFLSDNFHVSTLRFRENKPDYNWDYHTAPTRQFIVMLTGEIEIETSLGEIRKFKSGNVLLVEDVTGKGHRTKNIGSTYRKSLFIGLS